MRRVGILAIGVIAALWATTGRAQTLTPAAGQAPARIEGELAAGGAWFLDESPIPHTVYGGALRLWLAPRFAVGPEFTYWIGPRADRDQTLSGNVTWALRDTGMTPILVAGGGIERHSDRFGATTFASTEGMFTAGGGVRIPVRGGWYVSPEARIGWEPHLRLHVGIGRRF